MKQLGLLVLFALLAPSVFAQTVQGQVTNAVVLPSNPVISFCNAPANGVPCTNKATTYTSAALTTACPSNAQIVLDGTTTCVASPDAQNNWGVWAPPGQYTYTVTAGGNNFGPYYVTLPVTASSSDTFTNKTLTFADLIKSGAPANPATGNVRIYGDTGTGNFTCLTSTGTNCLPAVTSIFGRTGIVVAAANDYNFSQLAGSLGLGQSSLTTRGDLLTVNSTPALTRLALGANNLYPKSNGTDLVYSGLAAGGVGTCGANLFVTAANADAAPTCTQPAAANLSNGVTGSGAVVLASYVDGLLTNRNRPALGSDVSLAATTTTNILSQAITMPSSGGPFRVLTSWGVMLSMPGAASATTCDGWVDDGTGAGTPTYAGAQTGTSSTTGGTSGFTASDVSVNSYANSANITFTLKVQCNFASTAKFTPVAGSPTTYLSLLVVRGI